MENSDPIKIEPLQPVSDSAAPLKEENLSMFFSLFVKNIPVGTTEEELRVHFQIASQVKVRDI
jgi:RNA recognition motif-containing protein